MKNPPSIDEFNGDRKDLDRFLAVLDFHFENRPNAFNIESKKTRYAVQFMTGKTAPFRDSVLANHRPKLLQSWPLAKATIRENFEDSNLKMITTQRLLRLRQTSSVQEYAILYEQLCFQVNYAKPAWAQSFYRSLKPEICLALSKVDYDPEDYESIKFWAIKQDQAPRNQPTPNPDSCEIAALIHMRFEENMN
jgi:Retrotransposon gag protein